MTNQPGNPDGLVLYPWGTFRIVSSDGEICTPRGMKECGLIALLAFSPEMRRSREWLQDRLWSDRSARQAQTSLRRALANIRKSLGPHEDAIKADRYAIWLSPNRIRMETEPPGDGSGLLDSLIIRDPEFENWHRDLVQSQSPAPANARQFAPPAVSATDRPRVLIAKLGEPRSDSEAFAIDNVCLQLTKRLLMLGDIEISENHAATSQDDGDGYHATVELRSHVCDGQWTLHMRLLHGPHRACFWADRFASPINEADIASSGTLAPFLSHAVSAFTHALPVSRDIATPRCLQLQRAIGPLFTGNRTRLEKSELVLHGMLANKAQGMVAAWMSFAKLTRALEFNDFGDDLVSEAVELSQDGLVDAPMNSVVNALASIVSMKLNSDFDYGYHLAKEAVSICDHDPYALNALSQACFFRGEYERGYELSKTARNAASGLPNSFYWDIQACLAALGIGNTDDAFENARQSHLHWPECRPPLRYLVALSLLKQDWTAAETYCRRLKALEPDFTFESLLDETYPVETLRRVNLVTDLRTMLGR